MGAESFTSAGSFELRLVRSELRRVQLLASVLATVLVIGLLRRVVLRDEVSRVLAAPTVIIFLLGIAYQVALFVTAGRALRLGHVLAPWRWWVSAAVDLAVPLALLTVAVGVLPKGPIAALSAPVVLLMSIVILLSVLRLRPAFTLWTGLGAAAGHWAVTTWAIALVRPPVAMYPDLYTYGLALALTGVAGWLVAHEARRYVVEAAEE